VTGAKGLGRLLWMLCFVACGGGEKDNGKKDNGKKGNGE
jgi:hypothetical protein